MRHSSKAPSASTASRPAFVTIAKRPSCRGGTVGISNAASTKRRSEIFFVGGVDRSATRRGVICTVRKGGKIFRGDRPSIPIHRVYRVASNPHYGLCPLFPDSDKIPPISEMTRCANRRRRLAYSVVWLARRSAGPSRPKLGYAFETPIDFLSQQGEVNRLGQQPRCAVLQRLSLGIGIAVSGDHDDRDVRQDRLDLG